MVLDRDCRETSGTADFASCRAVRRQVEKGTDGINGSIVATGPCGSFHLISNIRLCLGDHTDIEDKALKAAYFFCLFVLRTLLLAFE